MGKTEPRMSAQTLKVLGSFLTDPSRELSGAEVSRAARLQSGTLYPILARLEEAGWLVSRWEAEDPHVLGRPRRRLYRITGAGAANARAALAEIDQSFGREAWA